MLCWCKVLNIMKTIRRTPRIFLIKIKMKTIINFVVYLILVILGFNTYLMYFYQIGDSALSRQVMIQAFMTLGSLLILFVLMIIFGISHKSGTKKSLMQFSLFVSLVLFVISLYARFSENWGSQLALWRWSNTMLYFMLFLSFILVSYELYNELSLEYSKMKEFQLKDALKNHRVVSN